MNWGARSDRPRWDESEEHALRSALMRLGEDWVAIARVVGRTASSCRSKAQQLGIGAVRTHAEAYQRPVMLPPPASTTARVLGDPLPGRSALDQKRAANG